MIIDIQAQLEAEVARRAANPEGIEVEVLTPDPDIAAAVAPLLFERLYPGRVAGRVLHVSTPGGDQSSFYVVVEDRGTRGLTTQGMHPSRRIR